MSDDPSFWSRVAEWVAGIAVVLIGLVWADNKRRMDLFELELAKKADKEELDRERNHIAELFRENDALRKDMNGGFQRITDLIHKVHIEVMSELAKKADR